jgi:hypothetical protein
VGRRSKSAAECYGDRPTNVYVHRRGLDRVTAWLHASGFTVGEMLPRPDPNTEGAFPSPTGEIRAAADGAEDL